MKSLLIEMAECYLEPGSWVYVPEEGLLLARVTEPVTVEPCTTSQP